MAGEIQQMSLKTAPLQFAQPNFQIYQASSPDLNILRQSMKEVEQRMYNARANREARIQAFNQVRSTLNQSEWGKYDEETNAILDRIDTDIELGNYGQSLLTASDLGAQFARNEYWKNAASTQAEYLKRKQEIDRGPYNEYTRRYWEAMNPYSNDGSGIWNETVSLVSDKSLADIWNAAVQVTPVRSKGSSWSKGGTSTVFTDKDDPSKTTTDHTKAGGVYSTSHTSKGGSSQVNEKRKEDIVAKFYDMLEDPNISGALRQNYNVMQWLYRDASERLQNATTEQERIAANKDLQDALSVLQNEDGLISGDSEEKYKKWLEYHTSQYAQTSTYRNTSSSSNSDGTVSYNNGTFKGRILAENNANWMPSDAGTQSFTVVTPFHYNVPAYNVNPILQFYNQSNTTIPYKTDYNPNN